MPEQIWKGSISKFSFRNLKFTDQENHKCVLNITYIDEWSTNQYNLNATVDFLSNLNHLRSDLLINSLFSNFSRNRFLINVFVFCFRLEYQESFQRRAQWHFRLLNRC